MSTETSINSAAKVEEAKSSLKSAFDQLENAIKKRNDAFNNERALRKQVTKELDEHIANLERILEGTENA